MEKATKKPKKPKKPTSKRASSVKSVKSITHKDIILNKYPQAEVMGIRDGFVICDLDQSPMKPLHSGLCRSENDAWKRACHSEI